jgi:thiamine biosynthesis lipoprotein
MPGAGWARVDAGPAVVIAERDALGTNARVALWPPDGRAVALAAVDAELRRLDRQASRFRGDSEISIIARSPHPAHTVSPGLAEAILVALTAARWTGGLVDPTVGGTLSALGYDRDFASVAAGHQPGGPLPGAPRPAAGLPAPGPAPGWTGVTLDGCLLRLPAGTCLDLGATAKGLGADRSAVAAWRAAGRGGVLVSLGGDIAIAGQPPTGGWPVAIAESSLAGEAAVAQVIRLTAGAVATSSVTCRRWRHDGRPVHHIVDPRTGRPAGGPWRTVSVAAPSCAMANAAATATIVAGEDGLPWLESTGLPARLVRGDGAVRLAGGWPDSGGGQLPGLRNAAVPEAVHG